MMLPVMQFMNGGIAPKHRPRVRAFSLVEVVLALGVVSFALMSLVGMLGVGLSTFRDSVSSTIQANIAQRIINESQIHAYDSAYSTNLYFDSEGAEVKVGDPSLIYTATVKATNFYLPGGTSPFLVNGSTAGSQLKVEILNRTDPAKTNHFTLVWPKQ